MARALALALATLAATCWAAQAQVIPDGHYHLQNRASGLWLALLDDEDGSWATVTEEADSQAFNLAVVNDSDLFSYTLQEVETDRWLSPFPAATPDDPWRAFGNETPPTRPWILLQVDSPAGTTFGVYNLEAQGFLSATAEGLVLLTSASTFDQNASHWDVLGEGTCWDSREGEACYNDTLWAKDYAVETRPDWYPNLSVNSSFADFQAHLHYCYWRRCPLPCAPTVVEECGMEDRFWDNENCSDVANGSMCEEQVTWVMEYGIEMHPEKYSNSSFEQVQYQLWQEQEAGGAFYNCSEPCCHDTVPGELCWLDADWARNAGINIPEINHVYPSYIDNQSSLAEFQAYLHLCYPTRCPAPCESTITMDETELLFCPDAKPALV